MPVDELTKEVSMGRRMQKAENCGMGVGGLQLRGEEGLCWGERSLDSGMKDDWDDELWQEPWEER